MVATRVVHKFGGSSVLKEASTILGIILASLEVGESPVVVLSALAGVTNLLEQVFVHRRNPAAVEDLFRQIDKLHRDWLRGLGLDEALLDEQLAAMRGKFSDAHVAYSFQEERDAVLAIGEPLSVAGFTLYFNARADGVRAEAVDTSQCKRGLLGSWLALSARFGSATPLSIKKNEALEIRIGHVLTDGRIPVVTGFIGRSGSDARARIATVGRGGSDLTACYLGALLEADEIRIWSDVPGMLSADPRVVGAGEARPINALPFRHAMEMAGGGGKLHPQALLYAAEGGVSVRMLSTFEPGAPGTLITNNCELSPGFVGVVQLKDTVLLEFVDPSMSGTPGFVTKVTAILADHGLVVGLMSTAEVELTMTVTDPTRRLGEALDKISEKMGIEPKKVLEGISLITVVHTKIDAGVASRVLACFVRCGVEALAFSCGASQIALQIPVPRDRAGEAVRALHEELSKTA